MFMFFIFALSEWFFSKIYFLTSLNIKQVFANLQTVAGSFFIVFLLP
jgi:hypothetical protein